MSKLVQCHSNSLLHRDSLAHDFVLFLDVRSELITKAQISGIRQPELLHKQFVPGILRQLLHPRAIHNCKPPMTGSAAPFTGHRLCGVTEEGNLASGCKLKSQYLWYPP